MNKSTILRWILFGRRSTNRLFCSTSNIISENKYNDVSDKTLEDLCERFDQILEDKFTEGADVSLSGGVLTVVVNQDCTYVINKQTPNRQIWFSSPLSGPKRFDLADESNTWIERDTKKTLNEILEEEFSKLLKKSIKW